jgi:peroxiredoxin
MSKNPQKKVGDTAIDFTLYDQNEVPFALSKFEGKHILLSFHPLAWTSVCALQMQSLEKYTETFEKTHTIALGISVDSTPSKKAWAQSLGIIHTRLLCDFWPHGDVAQKYGIFRENEGTSERVNIIIDKDRKICFFKIYPLSQLPDITEILQFLKSKDSQ